MDIPWFGIPFDMSRYDLLISLLTLIFLFGLGTSSHPPLFWRHYVVFESKLLRLGLDGFGLLHNFAGNF